MLNWRDPWHPKAGGAELVTLRILERLVREYGYDVEWFSALYAGAVEREMRNGINFVRSGSQMSVHLRAFLRYRNEAPFDVVVDQVNTVPFFSQLYHRGLRVLFIHQLAREVWFYELPWLLGSVGYVLEPLLLKSYRSTPVITVSPSSAQSLRDIGLNGPIRVIPEAIDETGEDVPPEKEVRGDIVVLGRLTPSKRPEHSIRAAAELQQMGWQGALHIAGAGKDKYGRKLRALATRLGLRNIAFHGRITNAERRRLLARAALLWMTSVREGWGLVVSEAAQHWTPAVVYSAPGLCDSVINGETGVVVPPGPSRLARETWQLLNDPQRMARYAAAAKHVARGMSWDRTAREFHEALTEFANASS